MSHPNPWSSVLTSLEQQHGMLGAGAELVVPGSISNLGSGFDALSVAVQLYLRVRVVELLPDRVRVAGVIGVDALATAATTGRLLAHNYGPRDQAQVMQRLRGRP